LNTVCRGRHFQNEKQENMKMKNLLLILIAVIIAVVLPIESNAQKRKPKITKSSVNQKGNLNIEAGIVFNSGDVKPVARVEFYLLDKDADEIIKEANDDGISLKTITFALNYPILLPDGIQGIMSVIKPHIVSSTTTDFQGKAKFPSVKAGNYYLFGFVKAGKSSLVWNLDTTIKSGVNSVILDNKNAALISDR